LHSRRGVEILRRLRNQILAMRDPTFSPLRKVKVLRPDI